MKLVRLVVVLCALVLLGGERASVMAYDDHDHCLGEARAERVDCRANYLANVALCLGDLDFDQWIGVPEAIVALDYAACREDASLDLLECRALIEPCQEE